MNPLILILAAAVNSTIGNLLLKRSREGAGDATSAADLFWQLVSPWFIGACLFYFLNLVCFAKALDKMPVSIGYPLLAGLAFLILTVSSAWVFNEKIGLTQLGGLVLIVGGMSLLAAGR